MEYRQMKMLMNEDMIERWSEKKWERVIKE